MSGTDVFQLGDVKPCWYIKRYALFSLICSPLYLARTRMQIRLNNVMNTYGGDNRRKTVQYNFESFLVHDMSSWLMVETISTRKSFNDFIWHTF